MNQMPKEPLYITNLRTLRGAAVEEGIAYIDALRSYAEGLQRFYDEVMSCSDDTWQCEVCGNAEPWWKDTNADYLTREVVATMKKGAERE